MARAAKSGKQETQTYNTNGAFLVFLQTSVWGGAKTLPASVMKQIRDTNMLKGRKDLVDPKLLQIISNSIMATRGRLNALTLPFPFASFYFAPKNLVERIEVALQEGREEFWKRVEEFITENYDPAIEEAEKELGPDLFNKADYPADIRSKFGFSWQFLVLEGPDENMLNAEMYERERERFKNLVTEAADAAIATLRVEFAEIISHITDRLTGNGDGKKKVFRNSLLKPLEGFFETFDARNGIFDDARLTELVAEAKKAITGVDVETMRKSEDLKDVVRKNLEAVKDGIDKALADAPLRKIRLV